MSRRVFLCCLALAVATIVPLGAQIAFRSGDGELDGTLNSLNIEAVAKLGPFTADLSVSYGVPQPQIQGWISKDRLQPAEAFLVLELARISRRKPDTVLALYKKNRGAGWGAVARSLGIKPGSPQFKALKAGTIRQRDKTKAKKKG
jgi:hypothetical protein